MNFNRLYNVLLFINFALIVKAVKRKWREEKLLAQMKKHKQLRLEKEAKAKEEEKEKVKTVKCGRHYTVAIALPGSILDNSQSMELRAYLAGQVRLDNIVHNDVTRGH